MSKKKIDKETKKHVKEHKEKKKSLKEKFIAFYKKTYKYYLIFTFSIFLLSLFIIGNTYKNINSPLYKDVTLKGGLSAIVSVNTNMKTTEVENYFRTHFKHNTFKISELYTNGQRTGFIIDTDLDQKTFNSALDKLFNKKFVLGKDLSESYISPSLSKYFFEQAMIILLVSFVLMSIVIFLYFRVFVPAGAVILSGMFDILVTMAFLDYFKIAVSISGIGALLMLIGYSIDTDVLLTNRLYKERDESDDKFEKASFAFKTGIMMSLTTLIAATAAYLYTNSLVIKQIALILIVGLCVDIVSTWLQNTGILLWWIEHKEKKGEL